MNSFIKSYWKTVLFFAVFGIVGGFFTGLYTLDSLPAQLQQQAIAQGATPFLVAVVTAVQSAVYAVILGFGGIFFSKKIGLWKDARNIEKKPLLVTVSASICGGLLLILPDILFFSRFSDAIANSYASKPTFTYIFASVTYGAVIEEVMIRLFAMSLIAFILHRLFESKRKDTSSAVLIVSNIISALVFAAGHLPATGLLLGFTPLIIVRCFLLNGALGLLFGYLYRKHGLRYAMLAHGGCHIVSKLIWILFL